MSLKENILAVLKNTDKAVSGQALAEQFGVSRNAVWKSINALKTDGYTIYAATNKGYCLSPDSDVLSEKEIRASLSDKTLPIFIASSLDSTNSEAKRLLNTEKHPAFLVLCNEQTSGKGRQGKSFYSPVNTGLYMTLVTTPRTGFEDTAGITCYAAVCVVNAIHKLTGKTTQIKWVNDIYADGKKVCGILTEAVSDFESGTVSNLIIGIGINLKPCVFPEEVGKIAGCLNTDGALKNRLAAEIANNLLQYNSKKETYIETYKQHSMVLGKAIRFVFNNEPMQGIAVDIDKNGYLTVDCGGEKRILKSGSILLA